MEKNHSSMFRCFSLFIILLLTSFQNALAQTGNVLKDGASMQAGITALPVYDILGLFPDNKISGAAFMGNFGSFLSTNVSFGVSPYYGTVSNSYNLFPAGPLAERQELKLFGVNTYLRGYIIKKSRFYLYVLVSAGIGNMQEKTIDLSTQKEIPGRKINSPIATFLSGAGVNYFITRSLAVEFNLPFCILNNFNAEMADKYFLTAAPTLGLQLYLPRNQIK
jgi:hypothetical protein